MSRWKMRIGAILALLVLNVVVFASIAWATVVDTPEELLTGAGSDLFDSLFATIQGILPFVVLLMAIGIGVRYLVKWFRAR